MAAAWHDHYTRNWWCWNKVKTKKCAKYQDQWLCKMTLNVFKKLTRTQAEGKGRDVLLRICWTFTMQSAWINRGPLDQVLMLQWKPWIAKWGLINPGWVASERVFDADTPKTPETTNDPRLHQWWIFWAIHVWKGWIPKFAHCCYWFWLLM